MSLDKKDVKEMNSIVHGFFKNNPVHVITQNKDSVSSVMICKKTSGITWDIKVYSKNARVAQKKAIELYNQTKKDLTESGELEETK